MTKCKYTCTSVVKQIIFNGPEKKMVYVAKFQPVFTGSEENKRFFAFTPLGSLEIGQYKEDLFQPGKEYYLDISEAQ